MDNNLPTVSFVTCTYNSQNTIQECLESINRLNYPKNLIEVIIVDGGSSDNTIKIVRRYSFCRIFSEHTGRPEAATAIGYNKAKNDYIVNFPSDNVILSKDWLKRMLEPFRTYKNLAGVETFHYAYISSDTLLNRYFSLFGMNDPVAYYLHKCDRAPYITNKWHLNSSAIDRGKFIVAEFTKKNLPTVGANGFIIKTKIAKRITEKPMTFFHIDACLDLLNMGFNKYAFVQTDIWHKTGESFSSFIKRKIRYGNVYFKDKSLRRYHLYNPEYDKLSLILFILFSITFIEPLIQSIKGFTIKKDIAWFIHPVLCFITVILYFYVIINNIFNKHARI